MYALACQGRAPAREAPSLARGERRPSPLYRRGLRRDALQSARRLSPWGRCALGTCTMRFLLPLSAAGLLFFALASFADARTPPVPGARQAPARDTKAATAGTGAIRGRVIASDTGAPLRRARVMLSGGELKQPMYAATDVQGRYEFAELGAGRYTLEASKSCTSRCTTDSDGPSRPESLSISSRESRWRRSTSHCRAVASSRGPFLMIWETRLRWVASWHCSRDSSKESGSSFRWASGSERMILGSTASSDCSRAPTSSGRARRQSRRSTTCRSHPGTIPGP